MKALSIRAPWWWCILNASKRVENRSERFPRYTGPVLLHAAKRWVQRDIDELIARLWRLGVLPHEARDPATVARMRLLGGHIVGSADIVRVRHSPSTMRELAGHSKWEEPGGLALEMDNVRAFDNPVPYRGALGLFEVPWDVEREQLIGGAA